jgi:hypothetical protein
MQPDTMTESLEALYERCAQEYMAGLTIENHMEATPPGDPAQDHRL